LILLKLEGDTSLGSQIYIKSLECLEKDTLKHLSTLKYLSIYRDHADIKLVEDSGDWAILTMFPTSILSYDTATYPKARKAIFLNGTSDRLKYELLSLLTPDNYMLRLNENLDLSIYRDRFDISTGNTFISYTCTKLRSISEKATILPNATLTPEAINLFGRNGYTTDDLSRYFANGAQWFGLTENGRLASTCFVFQNYEKIWEIAGVRTLKEYRRHGYARIIVHSALKYLLERGLIPRYEAEQDNLNSIRLARQLKMKEFLTIRHYLLETR
jgi:GNAT superfamily N-acetyltransferase